MSPGASGHTQLMYGFGSFFAKMFLDILSQTVSPCALLILAL